MAATSGITNYGQSSNLANFMGQLDTIKQAGNYNAPMKLAPSPIPKPPVQPPGELGMALGTFDPVHHPVSPSGSTGSTGSLSDMLGKLERAIRQQESNGNYGARNAQSGAAGGYQIMPGNFTQAGSGWDMEALGHDVSLQQFLSSPAIQDSIASYKLNQYLQKYGAAGAAAAWYGGPGSVSHMYDHTPQPGGYPSMYAYWQSVLSKM